MRLVYGVTLATAIALVTPSLVARQMQDMATKVSGGVTVAGWTGKADDSKENAGMTVSDTRFVAEKGGFHITTGPSATYWNPKNMAMGNYTVKATFTEPAFMGLNTHPHPYGIMIAGNDLGTPNMSLLYCAAYGDGRFIVRGFGPAPFQMNGGRGEANGAIHKAAKGQAVTQEIAMSVAGSSVTCSVNGTVVGTYAKADLVAAGKLKSTDGVYGLRFGHNTEATVMGFGMTKN
jgi:hypothetical protein